MVKLAALLTTFVLFGCTSPEVVSSPTLNDHSLNAVMAAVEKSMSMGIQGRSENGREFTSRPFLVPQPEEAQKVGFRDRGVAHVVVLGDMRPYSIDVDVSIERAKSKSDSSTMVYKFHHYDRRLAKKLLSSILETLDRGDRNKNVIDDFRPF